MADLRLRGEIAPEIMRRSGMNMVFCKILINHYSYIFNESIHLCIIESIFQKNMKYRFEFDPLWPKAFRSHKDRSETVFFYVIDHFLKYLFVKFPIIFGNKKFISGISSRWNLRHKRTCFKLWQWSTIHYWINAKNSE